MAEANEQQPQEQEKPQDQRRTADAALATSVPDDNHQLMQMIQLLLHQKGPLSIIGSVLTGSIMLVWVVAKWGVPAILAAQSLILQLHGDSIKERDADRTIAQQQLKATQAVSDGIGQLSTKIDAQGAKLTQLSSDVDALKQHQMAADQRLGKLSAEQAAQARALQTRKP